MLNINQSRIFFILFFLAALSACGEVEDLGNNKAPVANNVVITDEGDNAFVDDVLIGRYTYTDKEDDDEGGSVFRWLRNGDAIIGASRTSYTVVTEDSGQVITFEVLPKAATGEVFGNVVTSEGVTIENSGPTAVNLKIIDENIKGFEINDILRIQYIYQDVDGDSQDVSTFRWLRNGQVLAGQTEETYVLVEQDFGQSIVFEVTPTAKTGKIIGTIATSVDSAPSVTDVGIIDGNDGIAEVGNSLTGSYVFDDRENSAEGDSIFRWLRNGFAIEGATSISYVMVLEDSDQLITFEVTPVAELGTTTGSTLISKGIRVANTAPEALGVRLVDDNGGRAAVGDRLSGYYTYFDTESDDQGQSTFRWLRNNTVIGGATASTYILVPADVAALITFEVVPVAAEGEEKGAATASVPLITGTPPVVSGYARYLDNSHLNNTGNQLIIPFDQNININGVIASDFDLPVMGDTLGVGVEPVFIEGPGNHEITITLGDSPQFKTGGDFSAANTAANSASGIDVAAVIGPDIFEGTSGIDAVASTPIDLIPAYVDSLQSLGQNDSNFIVLGDVNGDGSLDMVVANYAQANRVYFNDSNGEFIDSAQLLGENNSYAVALGDLDADGDLDMVVANWATGNRVYYNNGGVFSDSGQSLGANFTSSITLADVDADGDLDMLTGNWLQGNRVYLNDGSGAFSDSGQSLGLGKSFFIIMGDLDSDNDIDMVVASHDQGNRVYYNDGLGNFTDSGQLLGSSNSLSLALGDLDADGDLDLVEVNYTGQSNLIYTNDGSGVFTDSEQLLGENNSLSVALVDMDSDGDLDMFVANNNDQPNRVYINDGSGHFSDSGQRLGEGNSHSIALGDVDGDGDPDIVTANRGQSNRIYFSSLAGSCDGCW